jgi:phosphatidylglycerophosphatase A
MKHSSFFLSLATLGPIGYCKAPGTIATIVTLPFVYGMFKLSLPPWYSLAFLCGLFFLGIWIITHALRVLDRADDPSEIVFDELVGCLVAFWAIAITPVRLILGFVLFRFFDITKFGFRSCEMIFGAWGVMIDDVIAGIMSNIILHTLCYWLHI